MCLLAREYIGGFHFALWVCGQLNVVDQRKNILSCVVEGVYTSGTVEIIFLIE